MNTAIEAKSSGPNYDELSAAFDVIEQHPIIRDLRERGFDDLAAPMVEVLSVLEEMLEEERAEKVEKAAQKYARKNRAK
jgi:hypothetical protein